MTTNNVAEYEALRRGVLISVALGIQNLRIFGDSNLVVKEVSILSDASMSSMLDIHEQSIYVDSSLMVKQAECVWHSCPGDAK